MLDTNILLRGILNFRSAAGRVVRVCEQRIVLLLLSKAVATIFEYPRDPKDEKFVELAIYGGATHIVSADKDLLSLQTGHGDAAKRFRRRAALTRILEPKDFLAELDAKLES